MQLFRRNTPRFRVLDGRARGLPAQSVHEPKRAGKSDRESVQGHWCDRADIFFRAIRLACEEHCPFCDARAAKATESLRLPADTKSLASLADGRKALPRPLTALVRTKLDKAQDDILEAAG
ncbi:hypothetical protein FF124_10930 [Martelella lutilitoris]|uniref:Uncharacterized protein n=1 Tax=Martelella lutilitoris TaxID=2583532 RepID=A0A5C4JSD8_9HYPH|nr:hypothetical protein [Martelella lutilitoris]TNB48084.1 hypothetical protein FF124_10930 [Martelella lutilitoris]